jgi:hypothetical protein
MTFAKGLTPLRRNAAWTGPLRPRNRVSDVKTPGYTKPAAETVSAPRTVKAWAAEIQRRLPDHRVEVYEGSYTPYRKPKGLRYRTWQGKTRRRAGLKVFPPGELWKPVYDYNGAETYRTLSDIAHWLRGYLRDRNG